MALSQEQRARRKGRVPASFIPALMAGDGPRILNEFYRIVGSSEYVPEDLSNRWDVYRGEFSEQPILNWHERKTAPITRRGEQFDHPTLTYVICTLDGYREADDCVLDVKATNGFQPLDEFNATYAGQLLIQREALGCAKAALLIEHGAAEPVELPLFVDDEFSARVHQRIEAFWQCCETLTPPVHFDRKRIVPPEQWRTIDLDAEGDKPNWAGAIEPLLVVWLETEESHRTCEETKASIKRLLPDDVGKLFGGGVSISRNRAGAVSIKRRLPR
jgi:hypothetical protein